MIAINAAIGTVLASEPALVSLVGQRIYQGRVSQGAAMPALVFQSWFIRDRPTTSGSSGFEDHRLQIDAYAETGFAADRIVDAVAQALDPRAPNARTHLDENVRLTFRQDTGQGRPTDDGNDTKLFRRSLDFKVQAARAA